jgi:hypothetical protein
LDPRVIAAAAALGMTIMKAKETAAGLNISLLAMLGLEEVLVGQIVEKYVLGGLWSILRRKAVYQQICEIYSAGIRCT